MFYLKAKIDGLSLPWFKFEYAVGLDKAGIIAKNTPVLIFRYNILHNIYGLIFILLFLISFFMFSWRYVISSLSQYYLGKIASEKLLVMEQVSSQVVHDIRSPLSALQLGLYSLKNISEKQKKVLNSATKRISNIVDDLNSNNRKVEVFGPAKELATDLEVAIQQIIEDKLIEFSSFKKLKIENNISFGCIDKFYLSLDIKSFKRVISNLLNNSVKSVGEEVPLVISFDNRVENGKFIILLKDNGSGITKLNLPHIWKKGVSFSRDGSGLGLFHAKETIESYGGFVTLNSELGSGTTIEITLQIVSTERLT